VHAWTLLDRGEHEEAAAVADLLQARVGRHDVAARLQVALIRLALATAPKERTKAEARVRDLRALGFGPLEAQARALCRSLGAGPADAALRVLVLGPTEVDIGDRHLARGDWKSQKALDVLQVLALAGERGATREHVIEAVWPDRDPDKGRTLLRQALSEIRRTLEPMRPAGESSKFLHTTLDRLQLTATTDLADAHDRASTSARAALTLFRGPFLADDPYSEWADEERRAATTFRLELAERVASDEDAPIKERVAASELLIDAESWREEHYNRLAALHRAAGDEAAARSAERRRDFDEG
jgi:DNA-binding SARP family transcriptional activator